jgi:hypothetical protein
VADPGRVMKSTRRNHGPVLFVVLAKPTFGVSRNSEEEIGVDPYGIRRESEVAHGGDHEQWQAYPAARTGGRR